ncbi:MAG TPA: hypothetical protein DIS81_03250 [Psychrobacter sp.]|nr:hypothetical protein [Psychrobacter sp.]
MLNLAVSLVMGFSLLQNQHAHGTISPNHGASGLLRLISWLLTSGWTGVKQPIIVLVIKRSCAICLKTAAYLLAYFVSDH